MRSRRGVHYLRVEPRLLDRSRVRSRHDITDARKSQRGLRFTAARVKATVALDRLVALEVAPVEIRGKVGAPFYMPGRVDMDRPDPRPARFRNLAAKVTRDLLEVVVGVGNDATAPALQRQQRRYDILGSIDRSVLKQVVAVPILEIGVDAEIDAHDELLRDTYYFKDVIEVVALDHGIEPDRVDAGAPHGGDRGEDLLRQPGNAALRVMAPVDIVQGNVELADAGVPEGAAALGSQHAAVRQQRDVFQPDGVADRCHELLEVPSEERLAAGKRHEHGIEEPRCVRAPLGFLVLRRCRRLPVIAEPAPRVTAHGDFEVHQDGPPPNAKPGVLGQEQGDMPRLETRGKHSRSDARSQRPEARGIVSPVALLWPLASDPWPQGHVSRIGSRIPSRSAVARADP